MPAKRTKDLFYIPSATKIIITPEKRLLVAILKRAINDYLGRVNTDNRLTGHEAEDAGRWLYELGKDHKTPFSFSWICEYLDIEPNRVLRNVNKLAEEIGGDNEKSRRLTSLESLELKFLSSLS